MKTGLRGYREEDIQHIEWNWIQQELINYQRDIKEDLYLPRNVINKDLLKEMENVLLIFKECGFVWLKNIDYIGRKCFLQIGIHSSWKPEQIKEVLTEVIEYGFRIMNLNKMFGYVLETEEKVKNILRESKFQCEGTIPDHCYWDGKVYSREIWSIVKKDVLSNGKIQTY